MSYPIFAPSNTWYSQGGTTVAKTTFTGITILDSYTPTGEETESWNADVDNNGDIKCYIKGTELIIAGNGSGKLALNEDSSYMFSNNPGNNGFNKIKYINGLDILDTSNSINMSFMFFYCYNLKAILINNWDTSNCKNFKNMFQVCQSILELNLVNFNTKNSTVMQYMFDDMIRLKKITLGPNFNFSGNGSASPKAKLPIPSVNFVSGADGKWHSEDCVTYTDSTIPNETKMTYYAVPAEVPTTVTIKYGTLYNIAKSTRQKANISSLLTPSQISNKIDQINRLSIDGIGVHYPIDDEGYITINEDDLNYYYDNIICITAIFNNKIYLMVYNNTDDGFYYNYIDSNGGISSDYIDTNVIMDSGEFKWPIDPNINHTGELVEIYEVIFGV